MRSRAPSRAAPSLPSEPDAHFYSTRDLSPPLALGLARLHGRAVLHHDLATSRGRTCSCGATDGHPLLSDFEWRGDEREEEKVETETES